MRLLFLHQARGTAVCSWSSNIRLVVQKSFPFSYQSVKLWDLSNKSRNRPSVAALLPTQSASKPAGPISEIAQQRRICVTTNLVNASTSRAKVTVKFYVAYLWDLPASSLLFFGPISAIRPVVFVVEWGREKSSLTWKRPVASHCLAGIGNPSQCSHPTPCQPHPGCSPCLSPHILHPLNNLQAPEFASGSSLRAVLTVGTLYALAV